MKVNLDQPEFGGKIIYSLNGSVINGTTVDAYTGDEIKMDFEPWQGWDCSPHKDGELYKIGNIQDSQEVSITINGTNVNDIFKEDDNHKPELTVVLDKSVGENMRFEFEASSLDQESYNYVDKWYSNDYKLIDAKKIGTEKPIKISLQNSAIQSGKAVRIEVKKDKKISDVRYINDLTQIEEPISIYNPGENDTAKDWYKSIKINISLVDVMEFKEVNPSEHTNIIVKSMDSKKVIHSGDLVEESQGLIIIISPKTGYYVEGGNIENKTKYQESMKYSKYIKKINKLIRDHKAKKVCSITLGTKDTFAKYTYTYGGKKVSGTVKLREGEKLNIEYEITDSSYTLKEKSGGLLGIGGSSKKAKESIIISSDLDATTVDKETFGIEIKEGD